MRLALRYRRQLIVIALASLLGLSVLAGVAAQTEPATATVEVTVWRRVSNPSLLYLSTRPEGGNWRTVNTALDMSALSSSGRFHQSNAITVDVPLADGGTATVEVTVWRRVSNPSLLYLSTRPAGGNWRTVNTALDMSALSSSGRFHQSNAVTVDVPLPDAPSTTPPTDRSQCEIDEAMAARVIASTVQVISPKGDGYGLGSAFYIGNGEFVTAGHVVDHNPSSITLRNSDISVLARLVAFYPFESGDVALLKASAPGMAALEWAGTLAPGAAIAVIGYPEGMGISASITRGIVSRMFTQQGLSFIQTDSAVSPGNSGGPLVDACGRVAGVMSYSIIGERGSEGLHFAVAEPSLGLLLQALRAGESPPPVEQPPDSTDPDEPTFWEINDFIDLVLEDWNPTLESADTLWEQWNAIVDDEDLPSKRLADIALDASDLSLGMVELLEALDQHPVLINTIVNAWYLAAWDYWLALAESDLAYAEYALGEASWATVQWEAAEEDWAYASYKIAECDLWQFQGYSNADEVCADVGNPSEPTWEQVDEFVDLVFDAWDPTVESVLALWDQWDAIVDSEDLPSARLADIALDASGLSLDMSELIGDLDQHPALTNTTVAAWRFAAWDYWLAVADSDLAYVDYALAEASWATVQEKAAEQDSAYAAYLSAACDLYRLQDYANADEVCADAGR